MAKIIYVGGTNTEIGESAFQNCSTGTSGGSIYTFRTVKTIGTYAFKGCTGIATIELNGATDATIGTQSFYGCTTASTIKVYSGFISIGESAFQDSTTSATSCSVYIGTNSSTTRGYALYSW